MIDRERETEKRGREKKTEQTGLIGKKQKDQPEDHNGKRCETIRGVTE